MLVIGERELGSYTVRLVDADIGDLGVHVDVVVSPDDNYLTHGGGASQAIWAAAGVSLRPEPEPAERPRVADVLVHRLRSPLDGEPGTSYGLLDADHVLHAITIDFDRGRRVEAGELGVLYGRVLDRASELGARSIAVPLLGAGSAWVGERASLESLIGAVEARVWDHVGPTLLLVVLRLGWSRGQSGALSRGGAEALLAAATDARATVAELLEQFPRARSKLAAHPDDPAAAVRLFREVLAAATFRPVAATEPDLSAAVTSLLERRLEVDEADRLRLMQGLAAASRALRGGLSRDQRVELRSELVAASVAVGSFTWPDRGSSRAPEPALSEPVTVGAGPTSPIDDPVRRLWAFLRQEAGKDDLTGRLEILEQEGYRGPDELRLLEYCVKADPVEILTANFTEVRLKRWLARAGAPAAAAADNRQTALRVLAQLGFRVVDPIPTLANLRHDVTRMLQELDGMSQDEVSGGVLRVAGHLQRVIHELLRFVAWHAFGTPLERWAVERNVVNRPLDRLALGDELRLLHVMQGELVAAATPSIEEFRQRCAPRNSLPTPPERLAELRNRFGHQHEVRDADRTRSDAREFLARAQLMLEELDEGEQSIRPMWIRVKRIVTDTWGRRTVMAENEDRAEERIYTDEELEPGRHYLMVAFGNPLRVDPLLFAVEQQPLVLTDPASTV